MTLQSAFANGRCNELLGAPLIDFRSEYSKMQPYVDKIRARLNDPNALGHWPSEILSRRNAQFDQDNGLTLFFDDLARLDLTPLEFFFGEESDSVTTLLKAVLPKQMEQFRQARGKDPVSMMFIARTETWRPFFEGLHKHGGYTATYVAFGDGTIIGEPHNASELVWKSSYPKSSFKQIEFAPSGYAPIIDENIYHGVPDSSYLPKDERPKRLLFVVVLY